MVADAGPFAMDDRSSLVSRSGRAAQDWPEALLAVALELDRQLLIAAALDHFDDRTFSELRMEDSLAEACANRDGAVSGRSREALAGET